MTMANLPMSRLGSIVTTAHCRWCARMLLQDQMTYELKSMSRSAPVGRVTSLEETSVRRKIRWQRAGLKLSGQQT
jgi:hypothetical protein